MSAISDDPKLITEPKTFHIYEDIQPSWPEGMGWLNAAEDWLR